MPPENPAAVFLRMRDAQSAHFICGTFRVITILPSFCFDHSKGFWDTDYTQIERAILCKNL
jgi:hypothetical protein